MDGDFGLQTNFELESTKNNFGMEYLKEDSTPKSIEVDPKHFSLESIHSSFNMESTNEGSITKLLVTDSIEGVGVIMIGHFSSKLTKWHWKDKKGSSTHEMIFVTNVGLRHPNFRIKGSMVYSTFLLSFHYCYVVEIYMNFFVKMRGNINKETIEGMKMRDKKEKMAVTFFGKGKIIFSKMDKFQQWIPIRDDEWAKHVGIFSLFSKQMNPIRSLVKKFL